MDMGGKIRQLREAKRLNIKQLACLVECTQSPISQLERRKTDPSISMLKKIAKALDVNIVDFFMVRENDEDVVTREEDRVNIQLKRWEARIQ
jgi:transcriptional regulator with XRE-family HTH domain